MSPEHQALLVADVGHANTGSALSGYVEYKSREVASRRCKMRRQPPMIEIASPNALVTWAHCNPKVENTTAATIHIKAKLATLSPCPYSLVVR
ncbi:hypothetical protein SCLCIDRAFT_1206842, partial [Scleroderma citrinum Foug A]